MDNINFGIIFLLILNFFALIAFVDKKRKVRTFYVFVFYVCYNLGYINFFVDDIGSRDKLLMFNSLVFSTCFFVLFCLYSKIFDLYLYRKQKKIIRFNKNFLFCLVVNLLVVFAVCVVFYVVKNGGIALLKSMSDGYGSKFELNAGLGFFSMFFYMYIPAIILFYYYKRDKCFFYICFSVTILCGVLIYAVIGGMRNVLFSGVLSFILIGFDEKYINSKHLILIALLGAFFLNVLAMIRYGNVINEMDRDFYELAFKYFIDSVSPVSSLVKIVDYYIFSDNYLYFDKFFVQFFSFIPRFAWPDKPILLDTNAFFFTKEILNYKSDLIISPTFVGEMIIMGSWFMIVIGAFIVSFFVNVLEFCSRSGNVYVRSILYTCIPLVFWMGRGTLELFMYKFALVLLPFMLLFMVSYLQYLFLRKNS